MKYVNCYLFDSTGQAHISICFCCSLHVLSLSQDTTWLSEADCFILTRTIGLHACYAVFVATA